MLQPDTNNIYSVSQLNHAVRQLLEQQMGRIWLTAEISNFSRPSSGHWYLTLKDQHAQVRCAMFRNANQKVSFVPANGLQVLVRASVTLYDPRGDYQLLIESMQPAGEGVLQQRFQALKLQLQQEGLFDVERKKPLPSPAHCIGIITSRSGAALHDMLNVLRRRDPLLKIVIYPSQVQGHEATASLVKAISVANKRQDCDVLIVGRGGGSLEDLWSFNEEAVARAIAASQLPVISAVGHETDVTIADFVADLRAATPSAAAELVSRNQMEIVRQFQSAQQRAAMAMDYYLAQQHRLFSQRHHRLQQQHPRLQVARQQHQLLQFESRLLAALRVRLRVLDLQQQKLQQRLYHQHPQTKLHSAVQQVQSCHRRLLDALHDQLQPLQSHFTALVIRLESVSPLATLARGYSVSRDQHGGIVKKVSQLKKGQPLVTRFTDGWVESEVTQIIKQKKSNAGVAEK